MSKTIFITGASTGIGRSTAHWFQQKGWNVVATMRSPEKYPELSELANVLVLPLDVTKVEQIQPAIDAAIGRFGAIDALVNNAGYGLIGAFESCSREEIARQFQTNVFGLMEVTRAALPHFRSRRQGVIVNIASIGGRIALPVYSLYHSTKWAVEGFSESLQYELRPFNIKVKIVEPGPIKTDFYDRSATVAKMEGLTDYDAYVDRVLAGLSQVDPIAASPDVTAKAIYQAVMDGSWRLRYAGGGGASLILGLRKLLPDGIFQGAIRRVMKG